MSAQSSTVAGSILTSVVTGFVVALPPEFVNYLGKLGSVFLLAVVAEVGRRLVARFWKDKP